MPGDVLLSDAGAATAVVAAGRAFAADRLRVAGIAPLAETAAEQLRPGALDTSIDAVGPAVGLLARAAELSGGLDWPRSLPHGRRGCPTPTSARHRCDLGTYGVESLRAAPVRL